MRDSSRAKLRLLREESLERELAECTFHPKLTPKKRVGKRVKDSEGNSPEQLRM